MPGHDLIVVGASAGGLQVLVQMARGLPPGLPAAVVVVCHFPADSTSILPDILSRSGALLATHVKHREPIYPGHIYVAPPDKHLVVHEGELHLSHGPRENSHRPAIDPLFRSAARVYGPRVIGVVLTGGLYDGVAGLLAIRAAGGLAVIQDPADALLPTLPQSALVITGADHVVPAAALAPLLVDLVRQPLRGRGDLAMTDPLDRMSRAVSEDAVKQLQGDRRGSLSVYTCPECGGSMWQVDDAALVRFRCHVGHVYNGEHLLAEQSEALEAALWTAVRIFWDKTVLARQLAARERQHGHAEAAERFEEQANLAERYGAVIQQYVLHGQETPPGTQPIPPPRLQPSADNRTSPPNPGAPAFGRDATTEEAGDARKPT
jgi:two-component system chemotaxis response regulator CheB